VRHFVGDVVDERTDAVAVLLDVGHDDAGKVDRPASQQDKRQRVGDLRPLARSPRYVPVDFTPATGSMSPWPQPGISSRCDQPISGPA
jgi:hypothetical protein